MSKFTMKNKKIVKNEGAKSSIKISNKKIQNKKTILKDSNKIANKKQGSKNTQKESDDESEDASSSGEELDLSEESSDDEELDLSDKEEEVSKKTKLNIRKTEDNNDSDEDSSAAEVSSDEEEDDEDADENLPRLKKRKVNDSADSESFSKAVNALLGTRLKAYDRKDPILARSKKQLKAAESEKLELKAKRLILAEKKQRLTASRNKNLLPTDDANARVIIEQEKKYKKIAQRGVIKLFNAILMTQTETTNASKEKIIGETKKTELMTELSKEKFLDLIQAAGKS
ncbi:hypothetical protein B5S28_g2155 [[Candida] boidinii]|uniref:Unnamed protein product n=1 Tax=Candida boidinii TaxID=5477 RepID=A0ACB5TGA2_CANBO|nr:hypothetical protein B5S28_g2155 [[Candida] boidinii]OWB72901.1 hypothetical protein B5S31_g2626 [[Candida] boidinii]OWB78434.1 hypothetical protein B5S32_g2628 [[Candida] boidinii]GME87816.1 unnamed protein product [[Candida] boidinii]